MLVKSYIYIYILHIRCKVGFWVGWIQAILLKFYYKLRERKGDYFILSCPIGNRTTIYRNNFVWSELLGQVLKMVYVYVHPTSKVFVVK